MVPGSPPPPATSKGRARTAIKPTRLAQQRSKRSQQTQHPQWPPQTPPSVTQYAKVHQSNSNPPNPLDITADVPTILGLIQELADYEKASSSVHATVDSLTRTLSHADPSDPENPDKFSKGFAKTLLLTDTDGTVAGMALYFYNYSTWTGVPGIYLEDLFVKEKYRSKGYGVMLLKRLAKEVLKVDGKRLEWSCLDWNEPSLKFYQSERIGASKKEEWVGLRVEGEKLSKLAE
jgi:GNAT superfamily N-acetyltransferase